MFKILFNLNRLVCRLKKQPQREGAIYHLTVNNNNNETTLNGSALAEIYIYLIILYFDNLLQLDLIISINSM